MSSLSVFCLFVGMKVMEADFLDFVGHCVINFLIMHSCLAIHRVSTSVTGIQTVFSCLVPVQIRSSQADVHNVYRSHITGPGFSYALSCEFSQLPC